jgi:hypothetical protein
VAAVGSRGGKPRKPEQHHLPKVGSKANVEFEVEERRKEVFHGTPLIVVGVLIILVLIGWLVITL